MLKHAGISLISVSLLVAGCGGGSSSSSGGGSDDLSYDGPTAAVVISDEATADSVTGIALSQENSTVLQDSTTPLTGVSVSGNADTLQLNELPDLAQRLASLMLQTHSQSADMLAGITFAGNPEPCTGGGTMTVTFTYSDPSQISLLDSMGGTFSNCIELNSEKNVLEKTNGSMRLVFASPTDILSPALTAADFSGAYTFTNMKVTNVSSNSQGYLDYVWLDGGFSAFFSGDQIIPPYFSTVSGTALVAEERVNGVVQQSRLTNFIIDQSADVNGTTTISRTYTLACTCLGGSITVTTNAPFIIFLGDTYPTEGQAVIAGDNASIRLTALDNTWLRIEYDLGGDDIYGNEPIDPASKDVLWTFFNP